MSQSASVNGAVCKVCPPLRKPLVLRQAIRILYLRESRFLACSLFVLFVSVVWVTGKTCSRARDKPRSLLSILEGQILRCVEPTRASSTYVQNLRNRLLNNNVSAAHALRSAAPADGS